MSFLTRLRAAGARLFFRNFGRLLVLAASAAQWTVVAWIAEVGGGWSTPGWMSAAAIACLYAFNRWLTIAGPSVRGLGFRVYTAGAFAALFCSAFLLVSNIVFLVAGGLLGALSAQALSASGQALVDAGLNGAFHWFASIGMAAIGLTFGYGYTFGQRALQVTRTRITVPGLARDLRIAQISDIHVGQNLTVDQLRRFVAEVNATDPDLTCITGDIADSALADLATAFPALGELRARFGVYAILGNHDHYAGADHVEGELRRYTSIRVLRDRAITLDCDGAPLHLVGLDDRGLDWARGLESDGQLADLLDAAPADTPVLLLAHRPDVFIQAAAAGVSLTLSGHTHGGQLAIPWFGGRRRNLAQFITRFDRGLYRQGESSLYVNSGLGVTGQRIRLFTPREISLFELGPA